MPSPSCGGIGPRTTSASSRTTRSTWSWSARARRAPRHRRSGRAAEGRAVPDDHPAVSLTPLESTFPDRLQPSIARLRRSIEDLLGAMPDMAVLIFDRQMRVRLMSGEFWRRRGYDEAAVVGQPVEATFAPGISGAAVPHYEAVLEGA